MDEDSILKRISTPMTDADVDRHTGIKGSDIIKYAELDKYNDITELLPKDKDAKIILIEDKFNSGHWVAILRYGKTIEYFNSYGAKWDTDWKFITKMARLILGQETNDMTNLMNKAKNEGWDTVWNDVKFQSLSGNIQTCGRWCVLRIGMMKMGYSLKEFQDFISRVSEKENMDNDYLVAKYVK
jgi:hypothetical protein